MTLLERIRNIRPWRNPATADALYRQARKITGVDDEAVAATLAEIVAAAELDRDYVAPERKPRKQRRTALTELAQAAEPEPAPVIDPPAAEPQLEPVAADATDQDGNESPDIE